MKQFLTPTALCALTLAFFTAHSQPALALESEDMAQVDVLGGWRMENGTHVAAIRITLAEGWHTYWRAPGDAGIPPKVNWNGSENLGGVDLQWPQPTVYNQNGMRYLGYENEVILPVIAAPRAEGDIHLSGVIDYGVCMDICIPMQSTFNAVLGDDTTAPDLRIQAALDSRPLPVSGATCVAEAIRDGMKIATTLTTPPLKGDVAVVVEYPDPEIWVSEAAVERSGRTITATTEMVPPQAAPFMIDRSELTITVIGDGVAFEARGCTGG